MEKYRGPHTDLQILRAIESHTCDLCGTRVILVNAEWWGNFLACRICDALMNDKYVRFMWEEFRRAGFNYTLDEVQNLDFKPPKMGPSISND